MELLIFVLGKVDLLDRVVKSLLEAGVKGLTILDSTGVSAMAESGILKDLPVISSLKFLVGERRPFNKTLFSVVENETVGKAIEAIRAIVDINEPGAGILFTVPVSNVFGGSFQV